MISDERYLMLYVKIAEPEGYGKPIEVSLDSLADVLYCTQRNVKLIVHKLEEEGFIAWHAGRGRGNRSRMTFLIPREKKLLELAQHYASKGEYKHAFEVIDKYGEGTSVRNQFVEWMNGHFGYRTELIDDEEADILRLPVYRPILTLDPKHIYYAFSAHMVKQLFDCLVQYDRDAGKVVPSLAHAWEHDAGGKRWTFHLRKGASFHHGRDLVAEDVVYSFERLRGSASGWFVRSFAEVKAAGPRTVIIKLESPNWLLPRYLCSPGMSIVPHELVQQDEDFWLHPVGTGPFRYVEWRNDRFIMDANPHYFQGRAHLDGVVIVNMPEDTIIFAKNWEQLIVDHDLRDLQPEQGWQKIEYICNGCSLLTWNLGKDGPQRSIPFRQAIDLLIDRKQMIADLGEDRIHPASGFYPSEQSYRQGECTNVERALELLRECGYQGETIRISTYGIHVQDAEWLRRYLAGFGVNVEVQVESWLTIRDQHVIQNADCLLYCVVFAEDEVCMIELFEQTGNFLREHLSSELLEWVEKKIDLALGIKDPEQRWFEWMDIERKLKEETHVIFLLHKKLNTFYNPHIKGVGVNSLGWIDFKDIWLERAAAN
ncbi:ABC transporter substrate-binding protein [Paenibacillus soyae]|uniref:ABC transporter substrate-binding protein n=1 Tax=Paenibacillus soyae TaxID=2969249 RepID=A0A9X2MSG7_9BACL|nr:ABC transporter substrate-binding protein [Paenibacillus soyae]MCR2805560.1 ABC transporter substrate-binding protein [Paenibacillus soyae]